MVTQYPSLSKIEIEENEAFWSSKQTTFAKTCFCGRLESISDVELFFTYESLRYQLRFDNREGAMGQPGAIAIFNCQSLTKTTPQNWQCDKLELKLLVPSLAPPLPCDYSADLNRKWNRCIQAIRDFFNERSFEELRTPTLVESPGIEEHIDVFETEFFRGSFRKKLYLPTSPEFHLKKALSLGWNKIFELKNCFRNDEGSPHHRPEFLMLEWYRAYSNLEFIADDTKSLLHYLAKNLLEEDLSCTQVTVAELFSSYLNFHLVPSTSKVELQELLQSHNIEWQDDDTWDDLYFRIFIEKIEPHLGREGPLLVTKYPASQAALARITEDGWADRFELYWKGLELANAFHELNDPHEQKRRFEEVNEKRKNKGKPQMPLDPFFMQALKHGLPPSGGIALGVERLFMCLYNVDDIDSLHLFS